MERLAGKVVLLWGWRRALTAFAAGAFAVLALAPIDFFAACFVSFPVLVWLLDGATGEPSAGFARRILPAFGIGWWFGFGYFLAGLWWVGSALLVDGSAVWALPLAELALPIGLALFYGLATALARLFWSDDIGRIAALAFGFGVAEWLRSFVLTGFPWNAVGYAAMPIPLLMQPVSLVGLPGMNALSVFVFAMPALIAGRRHRRLGTFVALALIAADLGFGYICLKRTPPSSGPKLETRIVQPAIDEAEKWDAGVRDRIFDTLLDLTSSPPPPGVKPARLVVWPETAAPFILTQHPEALSELGKALGDDQMLLTGAVRLENDGASGRRYYNSVVAINGKGEIVDAVDKEHLVPFGEYMPFAGILDRIGLHKLVELPGPFEAGADRHAITLPGKARALPLICYEIIFPRLVLAAASRADVIVNVTNDAWFGHTPGPYQHFRQAQVSAVEAGLPLIRAANDGISAVTDAEGRVVDAIALGPRGTMDVAAPLQRSRNPRIGDPERNGLFIVILLGALAIGFKARAAYRLN